MDLSPRRRALWIAGAIAGASCAQGVELVLDDAPSGTGSTGSSGSLGGGGPGPVGTAGTTGGTGGTGGTAGANAAGVGGVGSNSGGALPGTDAGPVGMEAGLVDSGGSTDANAEGGGRAGEGGEGGRAPDGSPGSSGTSGAGGAAGAIADAMSEPPPVCPTCPLGAQYECFQNGAMVSQLEFGVAAVNRGAASVALNAITMRYWYTTDGTGTQQPTCVSARVGCAAVSLTVHLVAPPRAGADAYLEVGFTDASMVAAGADTGEVRVSVRGASSVLYEQQGDRSFQSTGAQYVEAPNVTAYLGGKLAWGTEPP